MEIRKAKKEDISDITKIYKQGTCESRSYDFPNESPENLLENRKKWFLEHDERHPIFVAEIEKKIVGWISLQAFDKRKFLEHVGEISVYTDRDFRRKGIGKKLYQHVFLFAKKNNFKKIIAVCFTDNPAMNLNKRMGFKIIGTYKNHVQRTNNEYADLHILEKYL